MPVVFSANLNGTQATCHFPVSATMLYLHMARDSVHSALTSSSDGARRESSILGIVLSHMALEAFVNEVAEDVIPSSDLDDFTWLRKRYSSGEKSSIIKKKLQLLLRHKFGKSLPQELDISVEHLAAIRNALVHYRVSESAGRVHLPSKNGLPERCEDGSYRIKFDLTAAPTSVEDPLLIAATPKAAADSYNVALSVFGLWCSLDGKMENLGGLEPVVA